jgi:sugar (pentulose or hexulose) kinase
MKTGVDLLLGDWPYQVFDQLGIPADRLPTVVAPGTPLGVVSAGVGALTGLSPGTPVHAGMSDGCAGQIASGALDIGSWCAVLGTTTILKGVTSSLLRDPLHALYHHRPPGDTWWPGGASSVGAGALDAIFTPSQLSRLRETADLGTPTSAVTYPLHGVGERFPFVEPTATTFSKGSTDSDEDLYASHAQGVVLALRLYLERVATLGAPRVQSLSLVGGVARDRRWVQLVADVLGLEVHLPATPEGAVGMAVLAAASESDLSTAAKNMVGVGATIAPRDQGNRRFDENYMVLIDELRRRGWIDHHPTMPREDLA